MKTKWLGFLLYFFIECTFANDNLLSKIYGQTSPNRIYFGMWSYHLNFPGYMHLYNNTLVGAVYNGYLAFSFINCYNDRTYAVGIQRYWLEKPLFDCVNTRLGYRLGGIYGYDERLAKIAGQLKVLPAASIIYDINWKNLGIELSYTGVVIAAGFFIQF